MIGTPYKTIRNELGQADDWNPTWAKQLEVRSINGQTVYIAQPATLNATELAELTSLEQHGWTVGIDVSGVSKLRVNIRRDHQPA